MKRYVKVSIFDVPVTADRLYTYSDTFDSKIGDIVSVPFGGGNRKTFGVVREVCDTSDLKKTKAVISRASELFSISKELSELCRYISQTTFCSFGECVKCVLPPKALGVIKEYISIKGERPQDKNEAALWDCVFQNGKKLCRQDIADKKLLPYVNGLIERGIFEEETVFSQKQGSFSEYVSANIPKEEIAALLCGEKPKVRSAGKRAILDTVLTSPLDEFERSTLIEEAKIICPDANLSQLHDLCKTGILKTRKCDRFVNSYDKKADASSAFGILSKEQNDAYIKLCEVYEKGAGCALLHGVTGSGKTTVIKYMIDKAVLDGKSVIFMVPEIALTPQFTSLFCACYKDKVAVIHSGLSNTERFDTYKRIKSGKATVIIGTRSAVFAPVSNLGLIIMDEEGEHSYRSELSPKYHARDAARFRCAKGGAMLLLASATPSLESYYKASIGKYTLVTLPSRFGNSALPDVIFADRRLDAKSGNVGAIGEVLKDEIAKRLAKKEQMILFINRRGYNNFVTCMSCSSVVACPHCSVSMTYHKSELKSGDFLECHFCGYKIPVPKVCPTCHSEHLNFFGFGTQHIEEDLHTLFPDAKILRMDADSVGAAGSYEDILSKFRCGDADILLGTQMVAKGHDFPNVTLVGIIDADGMLYLGDYRAAERAFSLLTQVIGRAGRAKKHGCAVLQTACPDNNVLKQAASQDYVAFYDTEIKLREALIFPPFCDIVEISVSDTDQNRAINVANDVLWHLKSEITAKYHDIPIEIYGPFESDVFMQKDKFRMRLVIKCRQNAKTQALFLETLKAFANSKSKISIDTMPEKI
ncbi:MAG: primosomal protein N' [Clostridia bacterium]|nr:primosomal protein N' [Clostridia bacterium]